MDPPAEQHAQQEAASADTPAIAVGAGNVVPASDALATELGATATAGDTRVDAASCSPGWDDPQNSPHVHQVLLNKDAGYVSRTDVPFTRVLAADAPRTAYRRRQHEAKTVIHWGQRKLLMSEIEFLTLHGHESNIVVYAGAAPGTHIGLLAQLFPTHRFVLVDPAPFTVRESHNILCRQELFTDELANEFAGLGVLFVSDIRSADWQELEEEETDRRVRADQEAQLRWHQLMKPKWSMLKFRLPWGAGTTMYLDGDIYLPVWGPITTTESRLIARGDAPMKEYDNSAYEEQFFHFNTVTRVALYPHQIPTPSSLGIDHCYDCRAEIHILEEFFRRVDEPPSIDAISELVHVSSIACARNRTLASPNSDPEERKKGIRRRQWIDGKPAYDAAAAGAAAASAVSASLNKRFEPSGKVAAMMARLGYVEGSGLGRAGEGTVEPVPLSTQQGTRGLGAQESEVMRAFLDGKALPQRSAAVRVIDVEESEGNEANGQEGHRGGPRQADRGQKRRQSFGEEHRSKRPFAADRPDDDRHGRRYDDRRFDDRRFDDRRFDDRRFNDRRPDDRRLNDRRPDDRRYDDRRPDDRRPDDRRLDDRRYDDRRYDDRRSDDRRYDDRRNDDRRHDNRRYDDRRNDDRRYDDRRNDDRRYDDRRNDDQPPQHRHDGGRSEGADAHPPRDDAKRDDQSTSAQTPSSTD